MNPAMKRNPENNGAMAPPKTFGRDRSIGQTVTIRRGPYKGLLGIVKETTDTNARVELHTKNKTVNVPKDALGFKDRISGQSIDPNSRGGHGGGRGGFTLGVVEEVWEELLPVGGMVVVRQLRVSSGPQPGTPQEVSS